MLTCTPYEGPPLSVWWMSALESLCWHGRTVRYATNSSDDLHRSISDDQSEERDDRHVTDTPFEVFFMTSRTSMDDVILGILAALSDFVSRAAAEAIPSSVSAILGTVVVRLLLNRGRWRTFDCASNLRPAPAPRKFSFASGELCSLCLLPTVVHRRAAPLGEVISAHERDCHSGFSRREVLRKSAS